MIGKRKLQVDIVKATKPKTETEEVPGSSFEEKAAVIARVLERGIRKLTVAVVVVVLADTVRKVAVEQSKQTNE